MIDKSSILFWLTLSGLAPKKQRAILRLFDYDIDRVWQDFNKNKLLPQMIGEKHFSSLNRFHKENVIYKTLEKLDQDNIKVVTIANPNFGPLLKMEEVDPPLALYYKGNISLLKTDCVGIVGTRACTEYGKQMATKFASELAENGVTVVSGLATGIDGIAHEATLYSHGKTIAVLGSGLNVVTPVSNINLYERILENDGLIISEYFPNFQATAYSFPKRNRIIAGISKGILVVEAGIKSGAMITANLALEQHREVFTIPHNLTSTRGKGCNQLLYDGAKIVLSGDDICNNLGIKIIKNTENSQILLDKEQKKIYNQLKEGNKTFDQLLESLDYQPSELSTLLCDMTLENVITQLNGNLYCLTKV